MNLKNKLDKYLNDNLGVFSASIIYECLDQEKTVCAKRCSSISEYINDKYDGKKFQTLLFKYIDNRNLSDPDVYNNAQVDRRVFSKIRSDIDYHPSKETVIKLGLSLKLNIDEILDLLNSADYFLPMNNKFDLIIRFCFENGVFDINTVNEYLYDYDCKTLN